MLLFYLLFPLLTNAHISCRPGELTDDQNQVCYAIVDSAQTWNEARQSCFDLKYDLATIPNGFINTLIQDNMTARFGRTAKAWIGLTEQGGNWTWADGDTSSYRNFAPGAGTIDSYSLKGVLYGLTGTWLTMNGDDNQYMAICSSPAYVAPTGTNTTQEPYTDAPGTCSPSYNGTRYTSHTYNGYCYFERYGPTFGDNGRDLVRFCNSVKSTAMPVSVHSVEEQNFLCLSYTLFLGFAVWKDSSAQTDCQNGSYPWAYGDWLGYYNGTWLDGSPLNYTNFAEGEPAGPCILIRDYKSGLWASLPCQFPYYAVCKYPL